jgi:hypothetical protein
MLSEHSSLIASPLLFTDAIAISFRRFTTRLFIFHRNFLSSSSCRFTARVFGIPPSHLLTKNCSCSQKSPCYPYDKSQTSQWVWVKQSRNKMVLGTHLIGKEAILYSKRKEEHLDHNINKKQISEMMLKDKLCELNDRIFFWRCTQLLCKIKKNVRSTTLRICPIQCLIPN